MTITDIKRLKKKMPKRWRKELHDRSGLSFATIDRTFTGKLINNKVIDAAITLAQEYQDSLAEKRETIKSL